MVQGLAARPDLANHNEEELGNYWAFAEVDSGKDYSFFLVLTYFIKQKLFILFKVLTKYIVLFFWNSVDLSHKLRI
jgi:hypothetical protein